MTPDDAGRGIAVFTTVHSRTDIRISLKQVATLARWNGGAVSLFVYDGLGSSGERENAVHVVDIGAPTRRRMRRLTVGAWRMWRAVRAARPRVAHFHDPELIPVGIALRLSGIKVVYDVHEDVPRQILGKYWVPRYLRRPVAWAATASEWLAGSMFDGIVAATPAIAQRFAARKTITVQNFPILDELLVPASTPYRQRPPHFAYVGGLTALRGGFQMLEALSKMPARDVRLQIAGRVQPPSYQATLEAHPGWHRVCFHGWAGRSDVAGLLASVRAGLVLFHPVPNHTAAQPNKMFEYMAAGLPVIASDFALWRRIVNEAGCGLLVDPLATDAIAQAMQWILDNPAEAEAMGQRGRKAVEQTYNWTPESMKLIDLYQRLLCR